jgi:hypothetical protein
MENSIILTNALNTSLNNSLPTLPDIFKWQQVPAVAA